MIVWYLLKLATESTYLEMGSSEFVGMRMPVLRLWILMVAVIEMAAANVVLIGKNVSLSFDDVEANFGKRCKLYFYELRLFFCLSELI